jgi:demethoxyubiquinone hydroxylase (CLK1/Coq7/Cat5 family)
MQVLMQHLQQHLQALEQTDPNTSRAIQKQLRDASKAAMRQQEQAARMTPSEGIPMQAPAPIPA